jgi:hypothetical protein
MTNIIQYRDTTDTNRGPSPNIWADCPWLEIEAQVAQGNGGYSFFDDFVNFPDHLTNVDDGAAQRGAYSTNQTNGVVIGNSAEVGGALFMNSAASNQQGTVRAGGASFNLATTSKKLWFEARVKVGTIADTQNGVLLGLYEDVAITDTLPIAANGTLATEVFVGFHRLEGDGDQFDLVHSDGSTATTLKADAITLVADTYVKVGMVFESDTITFYKDGGALDDTLSVGATEYPDATTLGPLITIQGAASETTGVTLDWWRVAQLG